MKLIELFTYCLQMQFKLHDVLSHRPLVSTVWRQQTVEKFASHMTHEDKLLDLLNSPVVFVREEREEAMRGELTDFLSVSPKASARIRTLSITQVCRLVKAFS